MAENGRKQKKTPRRGKADLQLIVLLAAGCSVAKAAKETGISERTVYRRLQEVDFLVAISDTRETFLDQTAGELTAGMQEATQVLKQLLKSENEKTRLLAAREILANGLRVRELITQELKLQAIEQAIAQGATV